jgi:hypothetical protein
MQNRDERRKVERLPLRWPVKLWQCGGTRIVESVTSNLSSCGFYCISQDAFSPGARLECAIDIPTQSRRVNQRVCIMHCHIIVVRVEPGGMESGFFGLACRIQTYTLAASSE